MDLAELPDEPEPQPATARAVAAVKTAVVTILERTVVPPGRET
jgi:hypothetical protein